MIRRFAWLVVAVAAILAAYAGVRYFREPLAAALPAKVQAIPVTAGVAAQQDVPVYFDGLGTVSAFNTVTVRSRVDGQVEKILFTEGQDVTAGDVLAQIDPRPFQAALDQARAAKARDEAQLSNAKLDLDRRVALVSREFVSQQSVDSQKALVAQLAAAVQGDQAAIDNAQVQLGYTTIKAPIGGRVGIRLVDAGNIVHANDTTGLVVITQIHPISLLFTLPQDVLDQVNGAQNQAPLTVQAFKRDGGSMLAEGQLALVDNQIDTTTGTMKLKATFANTDNRLWPGQFVNARVFVGVRHAAVTVPAQAVQRGQSGTYAYVIKPDHTVESRAIKIGINQNGTVLVEDGLAAGEPIVVDGQYKLTPGAHVQTETADTNAKPQG
jgi:multidrug efflux system membrane fusion protein